MELDNILDYNIGNNIIEMNEFDFCKKGKIMLWKTQLKPFVFSKKILFITLPLF